MIEDFLKMYCWGGGLKSWAGLIGCFLREEEGQAVTEYILLMAIMVSFAVMIIKALIRPMYDRISTLLANGVENRLLKADFHTFKVGKS